MFLVLSIETQRQKEDEELKKNNLDWRQNVFVFIFFFNYFD